MLKKWFYKFRLENKLKDFNFFRLIDILETYEKFKKPEDLESSKFYATEPVCLRTGENVYDIFYDNIHIHLEDTKKQTIISLSLKHIDFLWRLDELSPEENKNLLEVYLWYDIEVLGNRRCSNTNFTDGMWNEYVYKTLCELEEKVNGYTTCSWFNREYGNREKKNNTENV